MQIDRDHFYAALKQPMFDGRYTQSQVDGMNAILDYEAAHPFSDKRHLAYLLATAYGETGAKMQPVRETFADTDAQAASRLQRAWEKGQMPWVKTPYWNPDADGKYWIGRGLPQVTFKENYAKFEKLLGIPFTADPDLMLKMENALPVCFVGMTQGIFTGKKLADYFNATKDDPVGARRIINAQESAQKFAGYHNHFLAAMI